jgi:hypothetical protein
MLPLETIDLNKQWSGKNLLLSTESFTAFHFFSTRWSVSVMWSDKSQCAARFKKPSCSSNHTSYSGSSKEWLGIIVNSIILINDLAFASSGQHFADIYIFEISLYDQDCLSSLLAASLRPVPQFDQHCSSLTNSSIRYSLHPQIHVVWI